MEGQSAAVEYLLNIGAIFDKNKQDLTFIDLAIMNKQEAVLLSIVANKRFILLFCFIKKWFSNFFLNNQP
jgi:hypothetical protein